MMTIFKMTSGAIVSNLEHHASIHEINRHARNIRINIIKMLATAGSGHPAGALGLADIYAALFFDVLHYDLDNPKSPDRDILVISNGHTAPVFYASLAEIGAISEKELWTLRKFGSRLQGHPERNRLSWIENTSGPLGEGLSQAAGMTYALKYFDKNEQRKVYCTLGDGELDEGNIWEATMFASKNHLNNLIAIVDRNHIQLDGDTEDVMPLEPLDRKFESFGWQVLQINGNDPAEFIDACSLAHKNLDQPTVILAHTIPGKGVDFMEGDYHWHGKALNDDEIRSALSQLEAEKYD
ncbi:MAG: transketolase [Candidatus Nomurabacteria bacterium]|jgi:transketolase|nr:transketolase [Candidatus Nomurabacteria bacterium]